MTNKILMPNLERTGYAGVEDVCREYYEPTFRFIRSYLHDEEVAADLTQVTFEKVVKYIQRFEVPEREDAEKLLKNWIFTIALNTVRTYTNKRDMEKAYSIGMLNDPIMDKVYNKIAAKYPNTFEAGLSNITEEQPSAEEEYIRLEGNHNTLKCIEDIANEEIKEVMRLQVMEECSYQEISERLGIPKGTVMSRISRGKDYIKKTFRKRYE